jgi:hypothetical protein
LVVAAAESYCIGLGALEAEVRKAFAGADEVAGEFGR